MVRSVEDSSGRFRNSLTDAPHIGNTRHVWGLQCCMVVKAWRSCTHPLVSSSSSSSSSCHSIEEEEEGGRGLRGRLGGGQQHGSPSRNFWWWRSVVNIVISRIAARVDLSEVRTTLTATRRSETLSRHSHTSLNVPLPRYPHTRYRSPSTSPLSSLACPPFMCFSSPYTARANVLHTVAHTARQRVLSHRHTRPHASAQVASQPPSPVVRDSRHGATHDFPREVLHDDSFPHECDKPASFCVSTPGPSVCGHCECATAGLWKRWVCANCDPCAAVPEPCEESVTARLGSELSPPLRTASSATRLAGGDSHITASRSSGAAKWTPSD